MRNKIENEDLAEMQDVFCYKKFIGSLCGYIVILRIAWYNKLSEM